VSRDHGREFGLFDVDVKLLDEGRLFRLRAEINAELRQRKLARPYDLCIDTPCSICGAEAGEFCTVYMAGGVREVPHKARTGR
jgi:hypothetical protein